MLNIREKVVALLDKNQPPPSWSKNLKKTLPSAGKITEYIPLVFVKDHKNGQVVLLFSLTAHDVCTETRCVNHKLAHPDGVQVTWGDLVPALVRKMLIERIAVHMVREGMTAIPQRLEIQYETPEEQKISVGGPA